MFFLKDELELKELLSSKFPVEQREAFSAKYGIDLASLVEKA